MFSTQLYNCIPICQNCLRQFFLVFFFFAGLEELKIGISSKGLKELQLIYVTFRFVILQMLSV